MRLLLAPGLGAGTLDRLELQPEDWPDLPARTAPELKQLGLNTAIVRALHNPAPDRLQACLDWLAIPGHHVLTITDPLYPPLLRRIDDAPLLLFVNGDVEVLVRPQLAIVGSRNVTAGGREHAREFAYTLSRAGFVITSGLALGVDGAAHKAAIEAGGLTVAVGGTGPDQVYPARHRDLAHRIVDNGAVISSFAPGVGPRPSHFPARNRIISGMSLGVLVVEAGEQSGSLITARLAGEQGREVFAIPGSIRNPMARGCHRLIRQGAKLVETPQEVVEELQPLSQELADSLISLIDRPSSAQAESSLCEPPNAQPGDRQVQRLLEAVGFDPTPIDDIIERSQMPTQAVSSMLLMLELEGQVNAHAGGRYSRSR
ncbi:MAG: DNA-processing protein DprA [Pseudomonadota bacterium]